MPLTQSFAAGRCATDSSLSYLESASSASASSMGSAEGRGLAAFLGLGAAAPADALVRPAGALACTAGGGGGAAGASVGPTRFTAPPARSLSEVTPSGTAAITSPESVTTGRKGVTGSPSVDSKAKGAPATNANSTSFQSSPERFSTMPQACRSAPPFCTTIRYEGRQTGVAATYPTASSCCLPSSRRVTSRSLLRPL